MAILKCKMCGGDIQATDGAAYGTCASCGTTSTLPKASDERKANLFNRANHFRRQNDFDKAVQAYENILNDDNDDAEAHWGIVLSRYGIEYVEDPSTHQRVPTCHRVQSESILKDADYLETLKHAPDEYTKSLYEEEAKKISEIQKGILAISKKEKPYDVFICYKETTDGGRRTKDSTIAQDIYYELTKDGYKVFFAKITLEDKLGQQYEPYIFSALNSAKVMLVIGTKKQHFEAVWVKNEWSRFLALKKKDPSRMIIPCYRDMDPYDMPDELANLGLQAQDMGKIGFLQDLSRNIKKMLEGVKTSGLEQAVPVVIPKMFTDKVINDELAKESKSFIEIKHQIDDLSRAIISAQKYMEESKRKAKEQLEFRIKTQREFFGTVDYSDISSDRMINGYEEQASRWQNDIYEMQNRRGKYNRLILESELKKSDLEALLRRTPEQRTEDHYQSLINEMNAITDEESLPELAKKFREMEGYKNAEALASECENMVFKVQYDRLVQAKSRASTEGEYQDLAQRLRAMNGYENTVELANECDNLAVKTRYNQLVQAKNRASTESEYQNLAKKFREMNGYKDTETLASECEGLVFKVRYDHLVQAKNNASTESEYRNLASQFREMNGYDNTTELASECDNQYQALKRSREEEEARLAEEKIRLAEEEAEKETREKARLAEEEAVKKRKRNIAFVLRLCLSVAYLFILYQTDIVRAPWKTNAINFSSYGTRCFPLFIFALAIGMVSSIFAKKTEGISGFFLLILMVLVQSITICLWREDVGILLIYLIGRIVINALSVIPGFLIDIFSVH